MAESRPKKIYGFAEQLATLSTKKISVKVTSPSGMYKDDFTEDVEVEETMTLCVNGLLEHFALVFHVFICIWGI
ncbi:hypothetical protein Hanom_Chr05g00396371 [Helianthus anomalus]